MADAGKIEFPIIFEDVHIGFEEKPVLQGVSFKLRHGETKILLGIAGSGKSTLLKLALGLMRPDSGRIFVLGNEVSDMEEGELFALRRRIGMVFQEGALFDSMTVKENVAYRLREEHLAEDDVQQKVFEALKFVELERTIDKFPSQLSGGMRRRVAIARALITQPEVILYDSPTGGLDPITSTRIVEMVVKQRDFYQTSALMVTHRLQDAFTMATHFYDQKTMKMMEVPPGADIDTRTSFLLMKDGKVIFDGTAPELGRSRDEYIREYIA